jgi:phospholipid/cholesterol/gamma-HCH transport system substrate-binding protein
MEPETRYTVVGATLLALIAAASLAFVWLTSTGRASDFRFYTVYFERQSLEGLQVGGDVNMRGVTVGRVEQYTITRDNINRVNVKIRVTRETPVSENTKAVVARNVLTGIARINLETPGVPGPELVKVPEGERFPVIPEGTSNLDQIADAVSRLAVSADTTLNNLNSVFGPDNQAAFSETLLAIRDLSKGLSERLDRLDSTARSIQDTAVAFQQSGRSIAKSVDRVADGVAPLSSSAGTTLREAQTSLREFTQATNRLERELVQSMGRLEKDTASLVRRTDDAIDISLHDLRSTSEELRASIELITRAVDRLQDPKAALLGSSASQRGPGEDR